MTRICQTLWPMTQADTCNVMIPYYYCTHKAQVITFSPKTILYRSTNDWKCRNPVPRRCTICHRAQNTWINDCSWQKKLRREDATRNFEHPPFSRRTPCSTRSTVLRVGSTTEIIFFLHLLNTGVRVILRRNKIVHLQERSRWGAPCLLYCLEYVLRDWA